MGSVEEGGGLPFILAPGKPADAPEILRRYRDYGNTAPDEVSAVAVAITMPADAQLPEAIHDQPCLVIGGVYAGDPEEGMDVLQPLRELGTPLADISQPMPFTAVQSVIIARSRRAARRGAKSRV